MFDEKNEIRDISVKSNSKYDYARIIFTSADFYLDIKRGRDEDVMLDLSFEMIEFDIRIQIPDNKVKKFFRSSWSKIIDPEASFIKLGSGVSLKLLNCKTTKETSIVTLSPNVPTHQKQAQGCFIQLDKKAKIDITGFSYSGLLKYNFLCYSEQSNLRIKDFKLSLKKDLQGILFNGFKQETTQNTVNTVLIQDFSLEFTTNVSNYGAILVTSSSYKELRIQNLRIQNSNFIDRRSGLFKIESVIHEITFQQISLSNLSIELGNLVKLSGNAKIKLATIQDLTLENTKLIQCTLIQINQIAQITLKDLTMRNNHLNKSFIINSQNR